MAIEKSTEKLDQIISKARKDREQSEKGYRAKYITNVLLGLWPLYKRIFTGEFARADGSPSGS